MPDTAPATTQSSSLSSQMNLAQYFYSSEPSLNFDAMSASDLQTSFGLFKNFSGQTVDSLGVPLSKVSLYMKTPVLFDRQLDAGAKTLNDCVSECDANMNCFRANFDATAKECYLDIESPDKISYSKIVGVPSPLEFMTALGDAYKKTASLMGSSSDIGSSSTAVNPTSFSETSPTSETSYATGTAGTTAAGTAGP